MKLRYLSTVALAAVMICAADTGHAQNAETRILQLEEQVRQLTGKVEELNYQLLQMQETARKTQEDNEFRFQQLEDKTGVSGNQDTGQQKTEAAPASGSAGEVKSAADQAQGSSSQDTRNQPQRGAPPRNLGALKVDEQGNIVSGTLNVPPVQNMDGSSDTGSGQVAALPQTNDPGQLYRNAYEFILSGDYKTAEAGFREHIKRFPDDSKTADAHYWLGEALLGQGRYREAAETFLAASQDYPKSPLAPDMLLKLGVSLVQLDQAKVACATFAEAAKRYPNSSKAFMDRLKKEEQAASC
jgi:tol-pal system protein YbgF